MVTLNLPLVKGAFCCLRICNTTLRYHIGGTIDGNAGTKGLGVLADAWQESQSDLLLPAYSLLEL